MLSLLRETGQEFLRSPLALVPIMRETAHQLCHSRDFQVDCAWGAVTVLVGGSLGLCLATVRQGEELKSKWDGFKTLTLKTIQSLAYGLLFQSYPTTAVLLIQSRIKYLLQGCAKGNWHSIYRLSWMVIVMLGTLKPRGAPPQEILLKCLHHIGTYKVSYLCGAAAVLASGLYGYVTSEGKTSDPWSQSKPDTAVRWAIETIQAIAYGMMFKVTLFSPDLFIENLIGRSIYRDDFKRRMVWLTTVTVGTWVVTGTNPLKLVPTILSFDEEDRIALAAIAATIFQLFILHCLIPANQSRKPKRITDECLEDFVKYSLNNEDLITKGILLTQHPLVGLLHLLNDPSDEKMLKLISSQIGSRRKILTSLHYFLSFTLMMGAAARVARRGSV